MKTLLSRLVLASVFVVLAGARDNGCFGSTEDDDTTPPPAADAGETVCPALACRMNCGAAGLKHDANGCDLCECNPPTSCLQDTDCPADLACDTKNYCDAPPGCDGSQGCPAVCYGRCVKRDDGCTADSECPNGFFCSKPECSPNIAPCGTVGRCEKRGVPPECEGAWVDENGNCRGPADGTLPLECCGILKCETDADCGAGLVCEPDPTDPCNAPTIDCFRAGRRTCQKGERACDDVLCDMACEYGFQTDANGCAICACNPGPTCGPVCDNYCEYGHALDANGCETCACNPGPQGCGCTKEYVPVCGSDGRTYGNACEAACANVTVAADGACGSCTIACLVYEPVCGADGVTYGCGEADAACHGTTVAHDGECTSTCQTDGECAPGQKCYGAVTPRPGTLPPTIPGKCVAVDYCQTLDDCSSLAPTIACVGTWSCASNRCTYACTH